MTGPSPPWPFAPTRKPRRGAKPRPGTYVDHKHKPPYSQDRMRWPSDALGTYRRADHAETEEPCTEPV